MSAPLREVHDAHRHLGVLPAFGFYGGPPGNARPGRPRLLASRLSATDPARVTVAADASPVTAAAAQVARPGGGPPPA